MSSLYRFDTSASPILMYEWDDGAWKLERLSLNEILTQNLDGTIALSSYYKDFIKVQTFQVTPDAGDDPDNFAEASEYFTDLSGNVIGDPDDEDEDEGEDDDGIEDDQDGDGNEDDQLDGSDDDDEEHGGDGDDDIDGADGDDALYGDQGDDGLNGGNGSDTLSGGTGFDVLLGAAGNDDLSGDEDDDLLSGDAGRDHLSGGQGDDDLDGGDDKDLLQGGSGGDNLDGGTGNDQLSGDTGDDDLTGGDGNDALNGGEGNDTLYSGDGDDDVVAGSGDDLIIGGSGAGNDRYNGAGGSDTVKYTSATNGIRVDLAQGKAGSLGADAGIGSDRLSAIENVIGGDHDDLLRGNALSNSLSGEGGDDTLEGGLGADRLTGGLGNDVFVFNKVTETPAGTNKGDVITDFEAGDVIDLSAIDARLGVTRSDAFTFLDAAPTTKEAANGAVWFLNGVLYASTDKDVAAELRITLTGVTDLGAGDLIL